MITLRPYQEELVNQIRDGLRKGDRVIAVSPTGSGKRMVACWMAAAIESKGKRVGIVTDRRTLVNQMAEECRDHNISFGVVMGDRPRNEDASVQICSIQTLKIRKWKDLPEADVWIIDECHKTTDAYKHLLGLYSKAKVVSFTATPVGRDGASLVSTLGPIIEPYQNSKLIEDGFLLKTRCFAPSEPNLKGVTINKGGECEFNQNKLGQAVEECTVFADIFKWWKPYSDQQTICFVPRVKFAYGMAQQFRDNGFPATVVEGDTKKDERERIFEAFANCEYRVLVSVGVLIEGFDCPIVSCGIDLTPNAQFRNFWQKVGRVRRPYEGQTEAIWLDFSGNVWRFPHPDDDPTWLTGTETVEQVIAKKKEAEADDKEKEPWSCKECGYKPAFWEKPLPGGECRGCGAKAKNPVRRIRMGNGEMKEVSLREQRKKKKTFEQKQWEAALYKTFYMKKSLHVAAYIYGKNVGSAPNQTLSPKPPESGSNLWHRKVNSVYPHIGCKRK